MAVAPVDIPIQVKGLTDLQKLEKRILALEKTVTSLQGDIPKASNSIKKFGRASVGASKGVGLLGNSIKSLTTTVAPLLTAVAGLTAGFKTIADQNFFEAKVRSLGVDSQVLVKNLKEVSKELKGQASVAELTGAAYDVASAGFTNAADASEVLKAASLGAVGGFSDIDTVANATTSVLNAYGLSADKAGKLVDGFIQTQNDGKIVVAEYAANIGKLAPIAASLGVPLEEINGAIAAVTANGVNAEIGITAIRSALAKLGANSKDATDILAKYGVEINATTISQEGLLKTLQKLSKVTDKQDLLKIVGTEAGQAVAPLLNDLPKLTRLIENQGKAAGVAQQANDQAANTIAGAWKSVQTAFQNVFSGQSEAAKAVIPILNAVAAAINAINTPAGIAALKIGGITAAVVLLTQAIAALKATALAGFFQRLIPILVAGKAKLVATSIATAGLTKVLVGLKAALALLGGPIGLLTLGVVALGAAFLKTQQEKKRFDDLIANGSVNELSQETDRLTQKLQVAENRLKTLRQNGVAPASRAFKRQQGIVAALQKQLNEIEGTYKVKIEIEQLFNGQTDLSQIKSSGFGRNANGLTYTVGGITYNARTGLPVVPPKPIEIPEPVIKGGGSAASGGSSGKSEAEKAADLLKEQTKAGDELLKQQSREIQLLQTQNDADKRKLQNAFDYLDVNRRDQQNSSTNSKGRADQPGSCYP